MTENPRPRILRHARQRTTAIVVGAAAGTVALTAVIAHEATATTGDGTGDSSFFHFDGLLSGPSDQSGTGSGVTPPSDSDDSDGESNSS